MNVITNEIITDMNIPLETCLSWIKEAFKIKDDCFLPAKCSIKPEKDVFFTSMPCLIPHESVYGLKMVSRIPTINPALNSTIMLYDTKTGTPFSLLDCNWITAMRTGAIAALSIQKLAKSNFETIGCVGLGNTCKATLDFLMVLFKDKKIKLRLKSYKGQEKDVIERYSNNPNISFEVVDEMEDLIKNSDVILSCVTSTDKNMGEDDWYKPGVTVVAVHTLGFQNCDLFFDKFIIDDHAHVKGFRYYNSFKEIVEFKDIIDKKTVRTNDDERIIAYNVGIALNDVFFAKKIYDYYHSSNDNSSLELNHLNKKSWI